MLYAIACGSPVAGHIGQLVRLAQDAGWQVAVVTTPDGRKFLDARALAAQTGFPVRSEFKQPGEPDVLPAADAMLVAPATVNTVNKWATGIADTLALGLLVEGYGLNLPMVVAPYTNTAMAAHPTFQDSLRRLRSWGVRVVYGDGVLALPPPGAGTALAQQFPWQHALAAVGPPRRADRATGTREVWLNLTGRNRRATLSGPAPPTTPRPAPAILRPQ